MAAPTPKSPVPSAITGAIGQFDTSKLKHTETAEKNPLPSKEALQQEKQEKNLRDSIEGFSGDGLKHVGVAEHSNTLMFSAEKTMQNIGQFDKTNLKHADTTEKNPLPSQDAVQAEKDHMQFKSGIEGFAKEGLHPTNTQVKTVMPDSSVINQEKTIQNIAQFDKNQLKHAETTEKNPLPDKAAIEEEKRSSKCS